jgi:DNA-binding MarR family transcriptional regulator
MAKKNDLKKTEAISELARQFSDATIFMHETIASKAGLPGTDHKYLGIIAQQGAMTAGQLAELTGLTTGAVTGLIDRLEKKKLVKREYDKNDRRKVMIVPNFENINKVLGPIFSELQKRIVNLLSHYSEKEVDIIEQYLRETVELMNGFSEEIKKRNY